MGINISRLRELAKIAMRDENLARMERDMGSIVALMDTLKVATIPASEGTSAFLTIKELREDKVQKSLPVSLLLEQSPTPGEFTIPKVVDGGSDE